MNVDSAVRTVAAVVAAAVVLAPFVEKVPRWGRLAWEAARAHGAALGRIGCVAALVAVATGYVPVPSLPTRPTLDTVAVETPADDMKARVRPIAEALANATVLDRMVWAEVWSKAATVVAGDAVTTEVVFTDTRALRMFNVIALDIAWRRIAGNQPGKYDGLKPAVEAAFAEAIGLDVQLVTPELRAEYVRLARAIAWAGMNRG